VSPNPLREHHELVSAMKAGEAAAIEEVVHRDNQGALQDYARFIRRHEGS
jgi:DNA-binding GntR family transcriptional regulator